MKGQIAIPETVAELALITAGFDADAACAAVGLPAEDWIDVTAIDDPRPRYIRARPALTCSYCQSEMQPGRDRCRTCGAPA